MAATFTESTSGSANGTPDLNSTSSTSMCLSLRSTEIEEPRVCVIQSLQTLSLHPPPMSRCAQLADNSHTPSNTLHLSDDNWELSGWFESMLQAKDIISFMFIRWLRWRLEPSQEAPTLSNADEENPACIDDAAAGIGTVSEFVTATASRNSQKKQAAA